MATPRPTLKARSGPVPNPNLREAGETRPPTMEDIKDATDAPYKPGKFAAPITEGYGWLAMGLLPFAPKVALKIAENAENCAQEWDRQSRTSPRIRRVLEKMTESKGVVALVLVHAPIVAAIAEETGVVNKIADMPFFKKLREKYAPTSDQQAA